MTVEATLLLYRSELVWTIRCNEKTWDIVYKCMTYRCSHLDLLESLDADAIPMPIRSFIALQGKSFEHLSDNGTNFIGGDRELQEAFEGDGPPPKGTIG